MRKIAIGLALIAAAAFAQDRVTVDAGTNVVLGRQDQITANMFGITAFEGFPTVVADRDYRARLEALRPGCIRFGGGISWFAPKQPTPGYFATDQAARDFETTLLYGARYPFGRFLPVVREIGAEPMLSLGGPPAYLTEEGTHNPSDFDAWAELCADYVGLWKRFDPNLRLVQVWNEPNAHWYRDPRAGDKGTSSADLFVIMANKVARAIKARFPEVQVGGPTLCWPPGWPPDQKNMKPWYTWSGWTLPWLRGTADTIDFYDFHAYGVTPADFAVQSEMVYNQALITQGRRLPIWITESSYSLSEEDRKDPVAIWRKRTLPYERLLLRGMLPQADKIDGNLYHDLHASHHTLLPGSAFEPDPVYWLFWILRDLRGTRVMCKTGSPDLLSFATMEKDRVSIVIFNDSDEAKTIDLKVSMPTGYATGPHARAIGPGPDGACMRFTPEVKMDRKGGNMMGNAELPAWATLCISFHMQNFASPRTRLVQREHFGDRTMAFLTDGEPVKVEVPLPQGDYESLKLRLGLLGAEGTEKLEASLNGKAISVQATALQEIGLEADQLADTNAFQIRLARPVDNPKLAVGFVSLVTEASEACRP